MCAMKNAFSKGIKVNALENGMKISFSPTNE